MRKTLLTTLLGLGCIIAANAQDGFQAGVKLGFTSTQYTTDNLNGGITAPDFDVLKEDYKSGYLVGGYMRIKLIGNLSFQPEIYYAKKSGSTQYTPDGSKTETQDLTLYTWDIPMLAHLDIIDLNKVKVYGITGPVLSFNAKNTSTAMGKEDINKGTWAYQLGAGVELWKLNFDVRYEWGLSNVSDGVQGTNDVQFDRKSDMLTIAASYRLF